MYRIISGKFKGRRIVAPKNFEVRPTTDFAKEGLFNILENEYYFPDLVVLDLFAGIGSISLEFASRGSRDITAVDNNYKHCQFIESEVERFELQGEVKVVKSDVLKFLQQTRLQYTIIFADAPFETDLGEYQSIVDEIFNCNLLLEQGELILEHASKVNLENLNHYQNTRKYGNVSFSFFR